MTEVLQQLLNLEMPISRKTAHGKRKVSARVIAHLRTEGE